MKYAKKIIVEMIPVILGILIALFLNNWKERVEDERFLTAALQSIHQELEEDEQLIKETLPIQYSLVDTITYYVENNNVSIIDCITKANGIKVYTSKSDSWWSFLNSKIEIVGFETISEISKIEEYRQFTSFKTEKLMDFVFENAESTTSNSKTMLIYQVLNLIESEEALLKLYEHVLETPK